MYLTFLFVSQQIIQDNYPKTVDWPCDMVPWEKTKDLPKKDWNQLFLALSKMDNWESSESSVKATDWEHFMFCSKNIFNDPEFCCPMTSGNIMLNCKLFWCVFFCLVLLFCFYFP